MVSSELRVKARESLKGKWGKAALLTLCYVIIVGVISFLLAFIPVIGPIANAIISVPISFGVLASFMKLKRDEEVGYTDFLNIGFSNFGKVWGVAGNMILKMIVPIVLVVVFLLVFAFSVTGGVTSTILSNSYRASTGFGGLAFIGFIGYIAALIYAVVKGYLYSLSYYVLYDNPDKTGKEIVEMSESMMKGNRWSYFWLGLTFIGWAILSVFTLHVGLLWLMPYIMVTFVCFYEALANKTNEPIVETEPKTEE